MTHPKDDVSFYDLFFPLTKKKAIFFIFLIGFVVFFNALFNQFVWDDLSYIQFNSDVHTIDIVSLFKENSFNDPNGQYRALTATYFAILYALFENSVFFYHLTQVLLHIVNSVLLFLIFRKKFSIHLSFFLSLIFLVHPIQVESVSFIGAAGNVLLFFFGILGLFLLQNDIIRKNTWCIGASFCLLLLSLLCKETGVVFLLLAISAPFLFHWKKKGMYMFFGFLTLGVYFFIRFSVGGIFFNSEPLHGVIPITHVSLYERMVHIPAIFFFYLKTFVFPVTLVIDQLWILTAVDIQQFYFPLFVIGLFLMSCIYLGIFIYKKHKIVFPQFLFFAVWFLLGISIHLQIIPLDMTVADRWFYVPIAGLLGMMGIALSIFDYKKYHQVGVSVAVCIIILFSIRTVIRNTNWVDNLTLFSHDAALLDNFEMENNLATFYQLEKKSNEALFHAKRSVALYPNETNLTNLAFIYESLNDAEHAKEYYKKVINIPNKSVNYESKSAFAYLRLGGLYLFQKDPKTAVAIYKAGVSQHPTDEVLWAFLAASYYEMGEQENALAAATTARKLRPTPSIQNLYNLILKKEKFDVRKL